MHRLKRLIPTSGSASRRNYSMALATGRPARFAFRVTEAQPGMSCMFTIYDHVGQPVACFNSAIAAPDDCRDPDLGRTLLCELDELPLVPGRFRINVAIFRNGELEDRIEAASVFTVDQGKLRGRPVTHGKVYGNVSLQHRWRLPTSLK